MKIFVSCLILLSSCFSFVLGQSMNGNVLYVSKQTGEKSTLHGNYSKTTDRYENGTATIAAQGPLVFSTTPEVLTIQPNQTIDWTGQVSADPAAAPAAGSSVQAKLVMNYNISYSSPAGGSGGTVTSTYSCGGENGTSGCQAHGGQAGDHEMVNEIGTEQIDFTVQSISCQIRGPLFCDNGSVMLMADVYPENNSENLVWTTPWGQFQGNGLQLTVPPGFLGGNIVAKFTIQGVSYSDVQFLGPSNGVLAAFAFNKQCISESTAVAEISDITWAGGCPGGLVAFAPATLAPNPLFSVSNASVTASINGITLTNSIPVVNKNKTSSYTFQVNFGANPIESILDILGGTHCSKQGSMVPNGQFNRETFKTCCANGVNDGFKYSGNATWNFGVKCQVPFYGIPYIATVDWVASAGLNASLGVNSTIDCQVQDVCADFLASADIGGGLGFTLASGFIQGDAQVVVAGIGVTGNYCFFPNMQGKIQANLGQVKVVGTVTTAWFVENSIDYVVFSGWQSPEWTF